MIRRLGGAGRRNVGSRASGGSGLFTPASLAGLFAHYRSDSLTTQVAGPKVSVWGDRVQGGGGDQDCSQGTDANRPAFTASNAGFNGRPSVDQAAATLAVKAGTASDWTFLHDGSGCTIFAVVRPTTNAGGVQILLDTTSTTAAATNGVAIYFDGANDTFRFFVTNGAAAIVNSAVSAGSSPADTTHAIAVRFLEGRPVAEYVVRARGVEIAAGNTTGVPAAGAATSALSIGALGNLTAGFIGSEAEIAIYNRFLSDAECAQLEAYAAARYGAT